MMRSGRIRATTLPVAVMFKLEVFMLVVFFMLVFFPKWARGGGVERAAQNGTCVSIHIHYAGR